MSDLANERVAYLNGEIIPESRVQVSFRDRGFKYGEAVFDTARTVRHKPFKLEEHVRRLFRSMKYLSIDAQLSFDEIMERSNEVLERNLHLIGRDDDYWLFQRITPGQCRPVSQPGERRANRDNRVYPVAPESPRAAVPRWRQGASAGPLEEPPLMQCPHGQNAELHQSAAGRPGGPLHRSTSLGGPARPHRQYC